MIMLKSEPGSNYEDRWDPDSLGTLTFFATLKGLGINRSGSVIDIKFKTGANKELRDGNCPIVLFCKTDKSYRYMGEFERVDSKPIHIVRNGYAVPGFKIASKNPELIAPYIKDYLNNIDKEDNWSDEQIEAFSHMYFQGETDLEDIREIAISLDKSVTTVNDVIDALSNKPVPSITEETLTAFKKAISKSEEERQMTGRGYDIEVYGKERVGQATFRYRLDKIFDHKCCLTGIGRREALVASHVMPWKMSNHHEKVDPNNGLLLNSFHDSLFDKHLMTVRVDGTVEYLDSLKQSLGNSVYDHMCDPYDKIIFPEDYHPWKEAFDFHNKIFEEKSEEESHS